MYSQVIQCHLESTFLPVKSPSCRISRLATAGSLDKAQASRATLASGCGSAWKLYTFTINRWYKPSPNGRFIIGDDFLTPMSTVVQHGSTCRWLQTFASRW